MDAQTFIATRNQLGLSQAAIATSLGVDQATVSRWEAGKTRIPAAIDAALAALKENLAVPADERPHILIADPVAEEGIALLRTIGVVDVRTGLKPEELKACIGDYSALVVRSETKVSREILAAGTKLLAVGRAGVGVDNVDLDAATEKGVVVVNAPQGNTVAAAEHTIALLMAMARHIPRADQTTREGLWLRKDFVGVEVRGKTLGVIGLGNVGANVARRGVGLEMNVIGHDPYVSEDRARALGVEPVEFDEILKRSDFITVHVPLTNNTASRIGAAELAMCKDGVRIINVARGGVIDEQALADAVKSGKVAGAAVDVFTKEPAPADNPLLGDPRIIVTPHLGASTAEAQERVAVDVAEQIVDILQGKPASYAVNAPRLGAETLKVIGPYIQVAESIGNLATQLIGGNVSSIQIEYSGEIAEHDVTPLRAAIIRGLLKHVSVENINVVNASLVAQARGWTVDERLRASGDVFMNLITLKVGTSGTEVSVSGTLEHGETRIVLVNDLDVEIAPEPGTFLLSCENEDRPGMIGKLGTLLGSFDINIQAMQVGRRERRGRALMLVTIEEEPTEEQLAEVAAIDGLFQVRVIRW